MITVSATRLTLNWLWRFLQATPAAATAACWSVIIFECGFLLTLFAGPVLLQTLLVLGISGDEPATGW
ncbi:hypothetical protein [Streptomyces glomeratus]|nr:hypothetical protein [Streptomyces glomeratus]MCF1512485.1 hypothetical protein [Streptomyces glomeratus]